MANYSVLTTVYAKEKPEFLKQCLDSMLQQTVPPSEYVLVKDGPLTKELDAMILEYQTNYPIFKVVQLKENAGCGPASIAGMDACTNEFVARIDSDDISLPTRCEKELALLESEEDLAVVGTDLYEFEEDPAVITAVKKMPTQPEEIFAFGKKRNPFNHSTVMFRKSIVQKNGGYAPLRRSLDLELFTRLLWKGCKCRNIGEPLVLFRTGSARIKRKKNWTNLRCDLAVYKKNYQAGYLRLSEYMYVVFRQIVFFIMPSFLAKALYRRMYRTKA